MSWVGFVRSVVLLAWGGFVRSVVLLAWGGFDGSAVSLGMGFVCGVVFLDGRFFGGGEWIGGPIFESGAGLLGLPEFGAVEKTTRHEITSRIPIT